MATNSFANQNGEQFVSTQAIDEEHRESDPIWYINDNNRYLFENDECGEIDDNEQILQDLQCQLDKMAQEIQNIQQLVSYQDDENEPYDPEWYINDHNEYLFYQENDIEIDNQIEEILNDLQIEVDGLGEQIEILQILVDDYEMQMDLNEICFYLGFE